MVAVVRGCDGRGRRRQGFLAGDAEPAPGGRAYYAIDGEAVASLQTADGGLGFGAERAVGAQAQSALQPGDGVSPGAFAGGFRLGAFARRGGGEVTGECLRPAGRAQRGARLRARDTVDAEATTRLKAAHGFFGFRSVDAVDADSERLLEELDLPAFGSAGEDDRVFGRGGRFGVGGRRVDRRLTGGDAFGRPDGEGG